MKIFKNINIIDLLILALIIISTPLIGTQLKGEQIYSYFQFPVIPKRITVPTFNWGYFLLLCTITISTVLPFLYKSLKRKAINSKSNKRQKMKWWGYVSAVCLILSWTLAWNRFEWFSKYQIHTFILLWFSLIILINALTLKRTGHCMILHQKLTMFFLFICSAIFWWYFEYLNTFVNNWYYTMDSHNISIIEYIGKKEYAFFSTISFSTVLPGVLCLKDYLKSFDCLQSRLTQWQPFKIVHHKSIGSILLFSGITSLSCIALVPNLMYPILWLSPSFSVMGYLIIRKKKSVLNKPMQGDWSDFLLSALAALICGFFWELWNFYSEAKWIYQVPYVSRFYIFEMPLIGFAGYIPFGIECLILGDFVVDLTKGDQHEKN